MEAMTLKPLAAQILNVRGGVGAMIMRGAFWSLSPCGVRLSEAEPQSAACGRVAAEGWTLPVDSQHLPLVDHTSGPPTL